MIYKDIKDKYLMLEKGDKDYSNLEYEATKTAIADFVFALSDNFTEKKKKQYISDTIINIENDKNKYDFTSDDLKYYDYYEEMLDLLCFVNQIDFVKLVSFIRRNTKKDEKKLDKKDESEKIQIETIHRITSLLEDAYNNTQGKIYVQIGPNYNKREEEQRKINKSIYTLLKLAILTGINENCSISKEDFIYEDLEERVPGLSREEINRYFRKTHNAVSSLSKKYKNKLKSKIEDKL